MARLIILSVLVTFLVPDLSLQQNIENTIYKINETSTTTIGPSKSRTLYDYQTRVVAYKDLIEAKCLLEILNGGESQISKWMSNGSKDSISKGFLISNQLLSKRQIWQLAGQRITEFCKGFPTYQLIKGVATGDQNGEVYMNDNIVNTRRKRQTRHYFQGRVRGQTQSQYLNFGKVDQPGKAEAESTFEGSKAVVSGNNGMGQAQSQSQPLGCDECYGPGYGRGSNGYDQEQTLGFGQGRPPNQRFPEQIIQQQPGPITGQLAVGREQVGGGRGQIGGIGSERERPGQVNGGHGRETSRIPGEIPQGPGQLGGGGSGPIGGGGPGHNGDFGLEVGGPGQFGHGNGQINLGNGHVGVTNGHPGGNGLIEGGSGRIGGGNGRVGGENGRIGGGNGLIESGNGHIEGGNGHIESGNGHIEGGNGHIEGGNGRIEGGNGRIVGGQNGQIHGGTPEQTGTATGHGVSGNGQLGGGSGTARPDRFGYGPNGQIVQIPGQVNGRPSTFVEQTGVGGAGPGQVGGKPGPFRVDNIGRPDLVGHQVGGPGTGQVLPDYGVTGTEYIRPPGQGGGAVGPDGRGKLGQVDEVTGQIIDLGGSLQKPTQYGGTFGGNLAGNYQSNHGQAGHFYGRFSGQYEAAGSPYPGYVKPGTPLDQQGNTGYGSIGLQPTHQVGTNGLGGTVKPTNGFQPEFGGPSYQPEIGQSGVQHPPVTGGGTGSKIYPPRYEGTANYQPTISGQPNYDGQRPFQQGQPNYGGQPNYSGQIPFQPLGSNGGLGGTYGQGLGTQGGGQYGQRKPEQYQNGFQTGNGGQVGGGTNLGQPGEYTNQYGTNQGAGLTPGIQGGPGYQPGINDNRGTLDSRLPFRGPEYSGQNGVGPHQVTGSYGVPQGTGGVIARPNIYGTGQEPRGQGGYIDQSDVDRNNQYAAPGPNNYGSGIDGTPIQYTDRRYPSTIGQGSGSQLTDGAQNIDDSDSQVQTSVQQTENGTHAQAQAQGTYSGGTAQSQVSGVYSGSGSFSASAGSDDGKRGAQTQVSGGDYGAKSSAQGRGGLGQSQAQVILSSETGDTLSSAQSGGSNHGTQTEVHASERGGMADAQANGAGSTSSQAQIGFTPYDENDEDNQTAPFRGGGTAGAQSGLYTGMTQAQIQGKFRYGIKYTGAAQAGSGGQAGGRNQTIKPGPFKPLNLTSFRGQSEKSETHSQKQANFLQSNKKIKDSTSSSEGTTDSIYTGVDQGHQGVDTDQGHDVDNDEQDDADNDEDDDEYNEDEYGQPEKPATRSIITQSSNNQRQHIILDPLEDLDATVHQSKGDFPAEGTILQPGQYIPGSGYKIPSGFRGTVKSMSNGRNTYAIGKNSQAQSVTLSPGSGRIIYKRPVYAVSSNTHFRNGQYGYGSGYTYQPAYQPVQYLLKNGKVLPNFVSVSRSETGSKNLYTGKKTPSIYYTQSSSCGIFTNHCVFNAGKKICFPKVKTNPDGSIMGC